MAEKFSVLKPLRLRNFIFSFDSFDNFEDTVTYFEKDMFRKKSLAHKQNFQRSVFSNFDFKYQTVFSFCLFFYFKKTVKKLSRKFEYSKSQKLRNFQY